MPTGRRPPRFVLALLATAALAAVGIAPAFAGSAQSPETTTTTTPAGPVTMTVDAGLDGLAVDDAPLVVDVELASRELVVGRLELTFGGTTTIAVEVPAGGVKQYRMESAGTGRRTSYTVRLLDRDGQEVVAAGGTVRPVETEVVGVLGVDGIDTAIRSARTTPLQRTPEVIALDPGQIDGRIAPLGYLVAGPGSVARLDDVGVAALTEWVRDGGRLLGDGTDLAVVAEPDGAALLAGTGVTLTRLGAGELGLLPVPTDVTPEEWSRILRDTPGTLQMLDSAEMGFEGGLVVAASSGQEAAVPALPWLLGGILLFIVLVGPVNMLVLRAVDRPEWSWATIPVLSVVFLVGFWVVGRSQVMDYTASHASVVVDDGAGGAVVDTGLLVQVADAGEHVLALGDGWQALPSGAAPGAVMTEGVVDADRVVFDLADLGLGSTRVRWEADPVDLETTLAPSEYGFAVTVANDTPWDLVSWGVVVDGRGFSSREPLLSGDTGTVEVVGGRAALPEPAVVSGMSFGQVDYEVVRLLGGHLEATWPALKDGASYVYAVTIERDVDVDVDGRTAPSTGTTLVVRRFEPTDADLVRLGSAAPELLSVDGASSIERYGEEIFAYGADSVVLRYAVPGGVAAPAAIGRVATQFEEVEIWDWDDGRFVPFGWEWTIDPARHLSAGGEMLVRASIGDGDVFVDASLRLQQFALRWSA